MRRLSRSPSTKPPLPLSKSPSSAPVPPSLLPRKPRIPSQRTIDTLTPGSQLDSLTRLNEEEILREVKEGLKAIEGYRECLMKRKEPTEFREELRMKEIVLREKTKELGQLQEEITRLKQVYNRHKAQRTSTPASEYSQQHLKVFTLAEQLQKLRKHLQLHIDHHRTLKQKAKDLHNTIKAILPQYYQLQVRRGLKPVSYGDFRKKAIKDREEARTKQNRLRSISERSLSIRSRSTSVREIVDGSLLTPPEEKTLWHMQRKRSIIYRARGSSQRKYETQTKTLQEQLQFLRTENAKLDGKIEQLTQEAKFMENSVKNHNMDFTFISRSRSQTSIQPPG